MRVATNSLDGEAKWVPVAVLESSQVQDSTIEQIHELAVHRVGLLVWHFEHQNSVVLRHSDLPIFAEQIPLAHVPCGPQV
jgi:hypothetical protein